MKLTKSIIDEIVSYIDFADIRAFVKNHPELVAEEEKKQIFAIGSIVTGVIIQKIVNLEFITCTLKGGEKYGESE